MPRVKLDNGYIRSSAISERNLTAQDVPPRIYDACLKLFDGNHDAAILWLTSPVRALNGAQPIEFLQTELGAREVRDLIGRLEDGIFT